MADYYTIGVILTDQQKQKLYNAVTNQSPISMSFAAKQIDHENRDTILVTKLQLKKLQTAKHNVTIKFSIRQLEAMHNSMMSGEGIFDSIGNFFKNSYNSAKTWVGNKINPKPVAKTQYQKYTEMKNLETANKVPTNADLSKKYKNTMKPNYNPKNTYPDYGQEYDNKPVGYKPPEKSGFDKFADSVLGVDKMINKVFSY